MQSLTLFAFVAGWILLAALAARFGVDNRDGIDEPIPKRLWELPPQDHPTPERQRSHDQDHREPPRSSANPPVRSPKA